MSTFDNEDVEGRRAHSTVGGVALISPSSSPPRSQRVFYKPLSASDSFATVARVAQWLRAAVNLVEMPREDADILLNEIWEPLTRQNPAERTISREGIEHLNRLISIYLPVDLNENYQPARVYAPTPDNRFEISCIGFDSPRMTLAIARLPRKRSRARQVVIEMDETGAFRKMRPDPTKGIRRMFEDPEGARVEILNFVRQAFELDRRRRGLS